jgi:hypothetical protein
MNARTLLDLAADYARAQDGQELARAYGGEPDDNPETIAAKFDAALGEYVAQRA